MVFQNPHGRLNYSSMLLDRDVVNFNFILFTTDCVHRMLPHNIMISKILFHFKFLKKKIKHMLGMNLKLNQYSILLSMLFIRYGSTFIQQICWVLCVSFCKNEKGLTILFHMTL